MKFQRDERAEDLIVSFRAASSEEQLFTYMAACAEFDWWARQLWAMNEIMKG